MRLFIIFVILNIQLLFAGEIMTTNDFTVIEKEMIKLDGDSLVLIDVDSTLIVPNDAILKPKGKTLFYQLIDGHNDRDLFREIHIKAPHTLVDERSIGVVQKLQQNKIPVIAFTAAPSTVRGMGEAGIWRVEELQRFGFDFSSAFPDLHFLELPKKETQPYLPLYKSGILFSSLHPKGDILIAFLQKIGLKPKRVIFVDDDLKYVQSVIAALDQHEIPCLGIHYTAVNEFPCDFNEERARFQVKHFIENNIWLDDQSCAELLDNRTKAQ